MDNTVCTDNADYGVCSGVARVFDIGKDPEFVSPVHANIKNVAHPQKKKKRGGGGVAHRKEEKMSCPGANNRLRTFLLRHWLSVHI